MIKTYELPEEIDVLDYTNKNYIYEFCDVNNVDRGFRGIQINAKLSIYDKINNILLIKKDGYVGWCGMGDQQYYSPEIWIGIVKDNIFIRKFEICYNRKNKKYLKETIQKCLEKI